MNEPLYRKQTATIDDRARDLLAAMTLEEKLAQLGCLWSTALIRDGVFDADHAASLMPHGIGQITRIGAATGLRPRESAAMMNEIQHVALERTRLGIPVLVHEEAVGGLCQRDATVFPQGLGLAATWNPDLVESVAAVIREQMRAVGARLALAPVMDVARDPRWGRVEETYGEDPVLVSTLATSYVRGLQTGDLKHGVAATGKHFLGYARSDGGRNCGPVHLGPRELREVYAEPFAAVIRDAGLAAMMNSYASIDGIPCASNPEILDSLLREELGFDGLVVSDYFTVRLLLEHHRVAATREEAARVAILAGLDTELPAWDFYREPLLAEVKAGRVPMAVVDTSVLRVLRLKLKLGLFDRPYVDAEAAPLLFDTPAQRVLARQAAAESAILLTNDGVLPLSPAVSRLAVIGPGAGDRRLLQGDYHYPAHLESLYLPRPDRDKDPNQAPAAGGAAAPGPYYTPHITPLDGLREALQGRVEVRHARGCDVLDPDPAGIAEAVDTARWADTVVLVLAGRSGLQRPVTVGEFNDATSLDLTGIQLELFEAVAHTGKPLVVVVMSGRVHCVSPLAERANALLVLFPPGEEGGHGLADVLTGTVNPSGKLPVSLLRSVGQVPTHLGYRAGGNRPLFLGDYFDSSATPLFAFGHGLSYTTFTYSNLTCTSGSTVETVEIAVSVRNSGHVRGTEVVQLYWRDVAASTARPDQLLAGFVRVPLEPGESRRVIFTVHPSRLAFFDRQMRYVVEPGAFNFYVGSSSADTPLQQTVVLSGGCSEWKQRDAVPTAVRVDEDRAVSASAGLQHDRPSAQ